MRHRLAIILPIYTVLSASSLFLAFGLRFDFTLQPDQLMRFASALPFVIGLKLLIAAASREHPAGNPSVRIQ